MTTTIIVAHDEDRLIGNGNNIPWKIPEDMALFKRRTIGQAVIMGRKTYESLPEKYRPLPDRKNIVLSRDASLRIDGVTCVTSPEEAIKLAKEDKLLPYVIGGGEIYKLFLEKELVDRMIISQVYGSHPHLEGPIFFPEIDSNKWNGVVISSFKRFNVIDYEKISNIRKQRDRLLEKNKKLQLYIKRFKKNIREKDYIDG